MGVIDSYADYLPVTENTPKLSLGEGGTPLVRSSFIGPQLGIPDLYFKLEGCNPTGSFKDRGMVLAVAKAIENGYGKILCASTGNTSAAAAAYAASAGIESVVLVPRGDVSQGKLSQAIAYGAKVIVIDGRFDTALSIAREMVDTFNMCLVNSVNPYRLEGQKTASFEIVDEIGLSPDELFIPVGNAGNITAYWKGFKEYDEKKQKGVPRMMGFEAAGAAPIVLGRTVESPDTIASAIRIGNPASWVSAEQARDESNGLIDTVTDEQIIESWKKLARSEGIFCEPASAASLAGLLKLVNNGTDLSDHRIVCVITGNGLKDPSFAAENAESKPLNVSANIDSVAAALGI